MNSNNFTKKIFSPPNQINIELNVFKTYFQGQEEESPKKKKPERASSEQFFIIAVHIQIIEKCSNEALPGIFYFFLAIPHGNPLKTRFKYITL